MTDFGEMAVQLVRSARLFPGAPYAYAAKANQPGLIFTAGACPLDGRGQVIAPGERFAIRRAGGGGTDHDWLSGPNKGYGFGSSGTPNRSMEETGVHSHLPRHDRSRYGATSGTTEASV
jgi:hypothetical protein